jgi:hypothetical protein
VKARPEVTLRYFNARGRAQFLRAYMRMRDIAFIDDRVPLGDRSHWLAIRDDRTKTGPFNKLPVMHWGSRTIAETLVIAAFLHTKLKDDTVLSEKHNRRHAMLASSVYNDLMLPIGLLIWADLAYPGVDVAALTASTLERIKRHLENTDRTLIEWEWLSRMEKRPIMIADCLLWDQVNTALHVFGDSLELEKHESLARFYRDHPGRPAFEEMLAQHPCQITGRPGEAQAIARLHEILAANAQHARATAGAPRN